LGFPTLTRSQTVLRLSVCRGDGDTAVSFLNKNLFPKKLMKVRFFVISVGATFLVAGALGVAALLLGHWLQYALNGDS